MMPQDIQWCVTVIHHASIRAKKRKVRLNRDITLNDQSLINSPTLDNDIENLTLITFKEILSEIEFSVLYELFVLDHTQRQVASRLHISQQQVSRIKNRAIRVLQKRRLEDGLFQIKV